MQCVFYFYSKLYTYDEQVDDNQLIASDSEESTLVDPVDFNERLSVSINDCISNSNSLTRLKICPRQLHTLDILSDGICKSTTPTTTNAAPTELGPALASAPDHEESANMVDQEEAISIKSSSIQDIVTEASSLTRTPSPALVPRPSSSIASSSVPSSSDSSLPTSKGKERQPTVSDDASDVQDTGAGQAGEEPAPKKKIIRTTRGKGRRIKKREIILEAVGEDASQSGSITENAEGPQASGSGLLRSQRDPSAGTLVTAESDATSVQRSQTRRGPQTSGSTLGSPQREPPASSREARARPTPTQDGRWIRRSIKAVCDENERDSQRRPTRSSNVPDASRSSRFNGGPTSARLSPAAQAPSSSGHRGSHNSGMNLSGERDGVREQDRVFRRTKARGSMRSAW